MRACVRACVRATLMHALFENYGKTYYCLLENSCELIKLETIKENL